MDSFARADRRVTGPTHRASLYEVKRTAREPSSEGARPALLGREDALASVARIRASTNLVTIYGPHGIGKTTVARAVLACASRGFFVECRAVVDPVDLGAAVASVLRRESRDLEGAAMADVAQCLRQLGADWLALDGLDAASDEALAAVSWLARDCPHLGVLVTSTRATGLTIEGRVALGPLRTDDATTLLSRAVERRRGTPLAPDELPAARALSERLGGYPLALELCAGQSATRTLDDLRATLTTALDLEDAAADRPLHHRSVRAAMGALWRALPEAVRDTARMLSAFEGTFDEPAARGVLGAEAHRSLSGVVAWGVVSSEPTSRGMRFRMLDAVRSFAREALSESGDLQRAYVAHAEHFVERFAPHTSERPTCASLHALDALDEWRDELAAVAERAESIGTDRAARARISLARLAEGACDFDRARAIYARIAETIPGIEDARVAASCALRCASFAVRIEHSSERAQAILASLGDRTLTPAEERERMLVEARVAFRRGDIAGGLAALEELRAQQGVDAATLGQIAVLRHANLLAEGQLPNAELAEAAQRALAEDDPLDLSVLGPSHAIQLGHDGKLEEAERALRAYDEVLSQLRPRYSFYATVAASDLARARGDAAGAKAHADQHFSAIERTGYAFAGIHPAGRLVRAALLAGDTASARALLRTDGAPDRMDGVEAIVLGAAIAALEGDDAAAGAIAEAARRAPPFAVLEREAHALAPLVPLGRGARHVREGDRAAAEAALRDGEDALARAKARIGDNPVLLAIARAARDRLARALEGAEWLVVTADGSAFTVDGHGPHAVLSAAARGVLLALARAQNAGARATDDELVAAGWPGESLVAKAASDRLRTAIAQLRRSGLGDRVIREEGAYALAPNVRAWVRPAR
jgi:predicted ATPase